MLNASKPTTIPPILVNCHTTYDIMPIKPIKPALENHSIVLANVLPFVLLPDAICIMPIVEIMKNILTAAVAVINQSACLNFSFTSIIKINAANVVPPRNALTFSALEWKVLSFDIYPISCKFFKYLYFHCTLAYLIIHYQRTTFVLVIFLESKEMARKKTIELCAYCASKQVTHPRSINVRKAVSFFLNSWSSSSNEKIRIARCECVCCCNCGANYQKVKMTAQFLLDLCQSLFPLHTALQDFRNLFGGTSFDEWNEHVVEIVQPEKNALHVIFRLCKKKAYLECQKVKGRFVVISVGVL